jgi:hypothetical protein
MDQNSRMAGILKDLALFCTGVQMNRVDVDILLLQESAVASAALEFVLMCPARVQQNRRDKSQPPKGLASQEIGPAQKDVQSCLETFGWRFSFVPCDMCLATAPDIFEVGFEEVTITSGRPEPKAFPGAQRPAVIRSPSSCTNLRARLACIRSVESARCGMVTAGLQCGRRSP